MGGIGWDDLLTRYLVERGGRPKRATLAEEVARLSVLFTHPHERSRLPDAYLDVRLTRAAYASYFAPANAEKVARVLRELARYAPRFLRRDELRVLDLGCGTGAAGLGLAAWLATQARAPRVRYEGVDGSAGAADDARWFLGEAAPDWDARARTGDLGVEEAGGAFDLVFLVDALNEVALKTEEPAAAGARVVRAALDRAAPDGYVIVVEPALRTLTRNLHAVRDALCAGGAARVAAPCLHERPCPALARDDAWCHEERPWDRPGVVADLDRRMSHDKRWLKYAYLVLTRGGRTLADAVSEWDADGMTVWRAIANRHDLKGKTRIAGCSAAGWCDVECLARNRSEATEALFELKRGDVFGVRGAGGTPAARRIGAGGRAARWDPEGGADRTV